MATPTPDLHAPPCMRFPDAFACGCTIPCRVALPQVTMDELLPHQPRLFVGPLQAAVKLSALRERNVSHIINLSGLPYKEQPDISYLKINIDDAAHARLDNHFEKCIAFIDQALSTTDGACLVHCVAGRSRSVTIVCAYLIARCGLAAEQAVQAVHAVRERADPNEGFRAQLAAFADHIASNPANGKPVVYKPPSPRRAVGSTASLTQPKSSTTEQQTSPPEEIAVATKVTWATAVAPPPPPAPPVPGN